MKQAGNYGALPETVGEAFNYCSTALIDAGLFYGHGTDNAWDEAIQLVLSVVDLPLDTEDDVLPHPFGDKACAELDGLLRRRIEERVPAPYLLGKAWFAGLDFLCDERALIPRSPMAELILNDFSPWYAGPQPARLLDLCCGGGCLGLAAAHYHSQLQVELADIDETALSLARENVSHRGLGERVATLRSDLFDELENRRYDIILSNPPYVDAGDFSTMPPEYRHEPELALAAGNDGLDLARRILARAADYLEPTGLLLLEVGNSWEALERAYPKVPFTWVEFEHGGHGVFALTGEELQSYRESLQG